MREIKFRGFGTWGDCKQWWYGDLTHYVDGKVEIIVSRNDIRTHNYEVDKKSVGQFTGLKDKNGVEIYEGDVLNFIFPNNGNKGIAPVVWEYGCWNVTDFKNNAGSNNIYNLYPETDCEIIGNIYQNPELLQHSI